MSQTETISTLKSEIDQYLKQAKRADIGWLKSRLKGVNKINKPEKQLKALTQILAAAQLSSQQKQTKLANKPVINFPEALPVVQHLDKIKAAIEQHQVVIIAGETGSGKTTQIPKICMQLGRGVDGMIGHTQPRRIAARTVANRIAEELESPLGHWVGYKVRFTDQVSEHSYVKLMTDGILLAEMQKDRLLRQYDTLIIDEAHERSLNIDFILGYIKQILPKRPDLKVIITSATIDPERFSEHFNQAPIIEVSGRTYPVDIWYRSLEPQQGDVISGILSAIDELSTQSMGDILVFLNGEREIRDTAYALEKAKLPHTHILPLFSRLTVAEQNRIFAPHTGRNIVLATNVAETSLTVPGIKYVIDTGTARISRYSYRTKVQRLPIEPISQASANQRAGRCGRVSSGICVRLYDEQDFLARPEFTDPEILRTNLATVILQMLSLGLGNIEAFPFVQAPDKRNINDGVRLLEELAAVSQHKGQLSLTQIGRKLSVFAIDPRLSKMLLSAIDLGCVHSVMVIVSALSIQDPRERPMETQQAADQMHQRFADKQSDFISLLNLWHYVLEQQKLLSNNQFRKLCQKEFLSYIRLREWQDIYSQLKQSIRELNENATQVKYHHIDDDEKPAHFALVHQAILSGLLSHIGQQEENREFKGARNAKFMVFPGSHLAKKPPKWLMAAELVETSRLFARMVAKIELEWVEPLAKHLVKKSYFEPHWEKKRGAVVGYEQVSLYGLIIVPKRVVQYKHIDPELSRELFIRHALIQGECYLAEPFLKHNQQLIDSIEQMEHKARRKNYLVDDEVQLAFYQQRIPEQVNCLTSFKHWWQKQKAKQPKLLHLTEQDLLNEDEQSLNAQDYPTVWKQDNLTLPLSYHFEPGAEDDGVSVNIAVGLLNQVSEQGFDWHIPALREELITQLIKSLPKALRKNFVPAPNYAQACLQAIEPMSMQLLDAVAKQLLRMSGVKIAPTDWQLAQLPTHLTMNFKVWDDKQKLVGQSRDLAQLQQQLQHKVKQTIQKAAEKGIEQQNLTLWNFEPLPEQYKRKLGGVIVKAYPALVDKKSSVAIELFEQQQQAYAAHVNGVARLILLNIPSPIKYLQEKLPNKAKLGLYFNQFGSVQMLLDDCILAACRYLLLQSKTLPRDQQSFEQAKDYVRAELADTVLNSALMLEQILSLHHNIAKKLKGKVGLELIQAHGDIKQQLEKLVFKGFVTDAGIDKLTDIKRYLTALERRLEKLPIDPRQDKLKQIDWQNAADYCQQFAQQHGLNKTQQQQIKWYLQEFRVSLFAQNLGTAYPISAKRIKQLLKTLIEA